MLAEKCKKCSGQLYIDSDQYGKYKQCLQCGYTEIIETIRPELPKIDKWSKAK
jgi:hypothetical protein